MFPSTLRSITKMRPVGRPSPAVLSTQTRTLYFCGPKTGDYDPDLPVSQHYHARSRTTNSSKKSPTIPIIPALSARPATPTPTLIISDIRSQTERHTIPSTNKVDTARKALERLVAATCDDATIYNTAVIIINEIARLEAELRRGEIEGKHQHELQKIREEIEGLKNLWQRMERRVFRE